MAITMQGSWTIRVKRKGGNAAWRFIVTGADTGYGTHDAITGNIVFASGAQWRIRAQYRPAGLAWLDAPIRFGHPGVLGGMLRFDVVANAADDAGWLMMTATLPVSESDHIVYGTARSYASRSLFNPGRDDFAVLDPNQGIAKACERYPRLAAAIAKLYPQRLLAAPRAGGSVPIVLPTGLPNVASGLVFESTLDDETPLAHDDPFAPHATRVKRAPFAQDALKAGAAVLDADDLAAIAEARENALRLGGEVKRAPGVLLRFSRYLPTAAERAGSAYSGCGTREDLGLAMTDDDGNYLFRFSRPQGCAKGERPDLIAQVLGSELGVRFETAPFCGVANLRRIDLCVPQAALAAAPSDSHEGGSGPSHREPATSLRSWAHEATRGDAVLVTSFVPDGVTASNAEAFVPSRRRAAVNGEQHCVVVTRRRVANEPRVEAAWVPPNQDAGACRVRMPL